MNEDLIKLIETYGTQDHRKVSELLDSKSKSNLISILLDLLTQYFNDKNSSTLREFLVVSVSDFTPLVDKIGYNGYRHSSFNHETKEYCEAKPKNILTEPLKRKLNGGGNFTDYSWQKFKRHKKENPYMLVAGFIDGRLIHVFSFKYNFKDFTDKFEKDLKKSFPNGDEKNKYLRSADFTLKHYKDAKDLSTKIFVEKKEIEDFFQKKYITKPLYKLLIETK